MTFPLIPYCSIDGVPTLKDSDLAGLFDKMERDGTVSSVFYGGEVCSRQEFVEYFQAADNRLWVVLDDDDNSITSGYFWVNTFEGRSARIHFCLFREAWRKRKTQRIALTGIETLLWTKTGDGDYLFDCLIGVTPKKNRTACRFIKSIGAVEAGVVPQMLWNAWQGESMDALLTYFTRETVEERKP